MLKTILIHLLSAGAGIGLSVCIINLLKTSYITYGFIKIILFSLYIIPLIAVFIFEILNLEDIVLFYVASFITFIYNFTHQMQVLWS